MTMAPVPRVSVPSGPGAARERPPIDPPDDEDDDIALPPLDDDEGEPRAANDDDAADLAKLDDGAEDPFDDRVADHLDAGVAVDEAEASAGAEDDRGVDIDVGADDEGLDLDEHRGDGDDDGFAASDEDDGEDEAAHGEDAGEEGTTDAPEDAVDDARLPALDADDEGTDDELELAEALLGPAPADEPAAATTAIGAMQAPAFVVDAPAGAGVPCACVVTSDGVVVAGGDTLLVVREGARATPRADAVDGAGAIEAMAMSSDLLVFATARGGVFSSADLGVTATPIRGFRPPRGPVELAASPGRAWILSDGHLWSFRAEDERLTEVAMTGARRVAAAGGVLVTLRDVDLDVRLERMRGDDERWPAERLAGAAADIATAERPQLAAAAEGRAVALAYGTRVAILREAGGARVVALPSEIVAIAFGGDGIDAPLFAATIEGDAAGALYEISEGGAASRLAELAGVVPLGLAWDARRERAWIASRAGLVALGRAARH
jgi:hypothetical protein